MPDYHPLITDFKRLLPAVDYWSLRFVETRKQRIMLRQDTLEPISQRDSVGVHITLIAEGGIGYAATCDVSPSGLKSAITQALQWARTAAKYALFDAQIYPRPQNSLSEHRQAEIPWDAISSKDKIDLLHEICLQLHGDDKIVDWWASLAHSHSCSVLITPDVEIEQSTSRLSPAMSVVAYHGGESQQRTFGMECAAQAGLEHMTAIHFQEQAPRVAEQSLQLLSAQNCPVDQRAVLLMPSQMTLQIHESIGHPLELDRILGDERNYAGSSFVTPQMFGRYQYGSELLNVTFDPDIPTQIATYRFDDEGSEAKKRYLIKDGLLLCPLGGKTAQSRAATPGVANSISCDWNRPPIDRMANINLEPGDTSLHEMIGGVEKGLLMDTNRSWSIDDSRNKFQFGCEYARLIDNGELGAVVKNPNYRGVSASFWGNLIAVGDPASFEVLSVLACGKGEPNQAIQVGHASPPCLFADVDIFGAE